jgi:hypothetical protein
MPTDPNTLFAIARAARQSGDRELERNAKRTLLEEYGIAVTFPRQKPNHSEQQERKQ